MEGTMAEIRLFAADFAPKNWMFCNGSVLAISTNQALFALLGTTYGGNGIQTFALPDLRGRTVIGSGMGPGLSMHPQGQVLGTENVTLIQPQLPTHNHAAVVTAGTGQSGGSATLFGVNNAGGQSQPGGNYLGQDSGGSGATNYAASGTLAAMHSGSVVLSNVHVPPPMVTIGNSGNSQPHTNMMPSLVLNYVICLYGIFPSRN